MHSRLGEWLSLTPFMVACGLLLTPVVAMAQKVDPPVTSMPVPSRAVPTPMLTASCPVANAVSVTVGGENRSYCLRTSGLVVPRLVRTDMVGVPALRVDNVTALALLPDVNTRRRDFDTQYDGLSLKLREAQSLYNASRDDAAIGPLRSAPEIVTDPGVLQPPTTGIALRAALCMGDDAWIARLAEQSPYLIDYYMILLQPGYRVANARLQPTLAAARARLVGRPVMERFRVLPAIYGPALHNWSPARSTAVEAQSDSP